MTYKHKQLSTKLVGADFSTPRASFLSLLPACAERSRSKPACAELVEASNVEASKPVEVSLYQNVKSSNPQNVKSSNFQILK